MNHKIALGMIVKDEERDLARCLNSAKPFVQKIYITDTGSSDKTVEIAKEFGAIISHFNPQTHPQAFFDDGALKNFGAARQFNLDQINADSEIDWVLWLDADDVLDRGENIQLVLDKVAQVNAATVFCKYLYQVDVDEEALKQGRLIIRHIVIEHLRERLIKNQAGLFKWEPRIHETLIPRTQLNQTDTMDFGVVHLTRGEDMEKALYRNVRILEDQLLEEEGKDPRTIYYCAKALFDLHDPLLEDYLIGLLKQYLVTSGWREERAQAWQYLAEVHRNRGEFDKAIAALMEAMMEWPTHPAFYIDMAANWLLKKDLDKALHWIKLASGLEIPKTTLVTNPKDMQTRILDILFNIHFQQGKLEEAEAAAIKMYEVLPDNFYADRVRMVQGLKKSNMLAHCIVKLAHHYKETGDKGKLQTLMGVIPNEIAFEPVMADLRNEVLPPKVWKEDELAIFCGQGFERWSPKNLAQGIGGSETAVINLAKQLASLGWKITVYGDPREEEGIYDGVSYLPWYHFNFRDKFNIFVSWRQPGIADLNLNCKKLLIWIHDIANPADYTPQRLQKITSILPLSEWQRNNLPNVPDDKFWITQNGIDLKQVKDVEKLKLERDPKKMIYASSYDRGLDHLLKMWPSIKKGVPDATLDIYYGWNLFDSMYAPGGVAANPERMEWRERMVKLMEQPGITEHGRVSHKELNKAFARSGVWAYPTHFGEISCQNAMLAQALGAVPCVINYAALKETVQHGIKVEGDIYDAATQDEFSKQLIQLLGDSKRQEGERQVMIPWAKEKFDWAKVAKDWNDFFKQEDLEWAKETLVKHNPKMEEFFPVTI